LFLGTYSFPSPLTTPKDYESLSTPLPSEALPKLLLGMDSGFRIEINFFVAVKLYHIWTPTRYNKKGLLFSSYHYHNRNSIDSDRHMVEFLRRLIFICLIEAQWQV
jgi:hypothetical protein